MGNSHQFIAGSQVKMYSMGGLAKFCVVPAHGLTELPNTLPYTESAVLGCAVLTGLWCNGSCWFLRDFVSGGESDLPMDNQFLKVIDAYMSAIQQTQMLCTCIEGSCSPANQPQPIASDLCSIF